MNKVVHFEIPADDLERAKKFYADVFGWNIVPFDNETVMVATTDSDEQTMAPKEPGAINGDISRRIPTFQHPVVVMDVPSIDEHMEKIEAAGGKKIGEKAEIPQMGWYQYFEDPEGNVLGVWENLK